MAWHWEGCDSAKYLPKSYFKERSVSLGSDSMNECCLLRDCPQGSFIGPLPWRWCMDELLQEDSMVEWNAFVHYHDVCIIRKKIVAVSNSGAGGTSCMSGSKNKY